jgi:O-antigen ligase
MITDTNYGGIDNASNRNRLFLLSLTIQSIQDRPMFGYGTERFKQVSNERAQSIPGVKSHGAHSEYQRMAVNNGSLGLALYLLIWILLFDDIRKHRSFYINNTFTLWIFTTVFVIFGIVINLFLGGGIINRVLLIIPAAGVVALRNHRKTLYTRYNFCHIS